MKWSLVSNNGLFDDHIIEATGSAQSKEACHTVQMAFSLTAMAQSLLCPMSRKASATDGAELLGQTITLDRRVHLTCKSSPRPYSWNFYFNY
ncbi:Hypothetical predicted protein [Marmota monax]|uniref:Uncharacterized protein n=1 Tax=Marmota monax TaxID=9995 RepID=A0A5E4C8M2_MARMO|nr:hypothetical protein GHT09_019493 [Marmota monax]VTJ78066.1 Hypothetical predicted protein [Marmota monax]